MTNTLDVIGLVALATAGFLVSLAVGFALVGGGCLLLSWSITRKRTAKAVK
jgi:hypothetical protein